MSEELLARIAAALERMAPAPMPAPDYTGEAFLWHSGPDRLEAIGRVSRVDLSLLVGVDRSRDTLLENTRHFAGGLPANNALLWGARGMGKSSLVKAVHAAISGMLPGPFAYAERWDEKTGTYLGLAIERAGNAPVVIDSDSVIIKPNEA